jgi:glycosyltransferase involved in cell wall biosynthesis
VLFVGVLRESKGVLDLVDACAKLRADGVAFELHLMGECQPPAFGDVIAQRAREADIADAVVMVGRRTGEDKWGEYLRADVFCFPTFFEYETFSLVVLEAMQFELPVVATSWRGVKDIVRHGETGYLVPVHDPSEVANRLAQLLADAGLRRSMGSAGRRRYLENFTDEHYRRGLEAAICLVSAETP